MLNNVIVKVLGIAQDAGVPQANCYCEHCREARMHPSRRRMVSSLALISPNDHSWFLFDATPHFPEQLELVQQCYPGIDLMAGIFLTHAHIGHYTGLMYLGKEAISTHNSAVWCGQQMAEILRKHVPWSQLVDLANIQLLPLVDGETIHLSSPISVTPLLVPHRNEYSETYGFIIQGPQRRLLYIPDIEIGRAHV